MRFPLLVLALLLVVATAATAQPRPSRPSTHAQRLTAELFIAIRNNDATGAKIALAHGADPNGVNWLGLTPLMWAAAHGNQSIVDTLLSHGAKQETYTIFGNPLLLALIGRQEKMALYLLAKGAHLHPARIDGVTPLMLAASNDYLKLTQQILQRKDDPNIKDNDGVTALMYAARCGKMAVARVLLSAGAEVDARDSHGQTALMTAAANGHSQVVDLLLEHHASVDLRDNAGETALLLAARYSGDPGVIGSLLHSRADISAVDGWGMTSFALATARGYAEAAALLRQAGAPAAVQNTGLQDTAMPIEVRTREAIKTSLAVLQTGMKTFAGRAQCTSCHHQGLGMMALGAAQQQGFAVDKQLVGSYLQRIGEDGKEGAPLIHQALSDPKVAATVPAVDIGDISIGTGYIFAGLIANRVPPNPGLSEMARFVADQQAPDGHWGFGVRREPLQSSYLTTTALVLQVLRHYASPKQADQVGRRYQRAKQWLLSAPAPQTEDKASRLLGLTWAGAAPEEKQASLRELLAAQRPDGGWPQLESMRSDAYATGLALYALHIGGGLSTSDPAFRQGIEFLLRTQDEDGSWYINKRTMPANTYFDAGFPHGESQYASFGATCWATLALLQAEEPSQLSRR